MLASFSGVFETLLKALPASTYPACIPLLKMLVAVSEVFGY